MKDARRAVKSISDLGYRFKVEWDSKIGPKFMVRLRNREFALVFCHRERNRCITFLGYTSPVCARCLGVYLGLIPSLFLFLFNLSIPFPLFIFLLSPLFIDGFTQLNGFRESTNVIRLLTGIFFTVGLQPIVKVILGLG